MGLFIPLSSVTAIAPDWFGDEGLPKVWRW